MNQRSTIKNKYIKRIIAIILMFMVLAPILWFVDNFYFGSKEHNVQRLKGFYLEDKNSLDVVFLGASELYNDYSPALAYDSSGITSYMFACQYNPITLYKYELKEIEKRQSPKVLVVSIDPICYEKDADIVSYSATRYLSDSMPFSKNKLDLVFDRGTDSVFSYIFPTAKYHGQWTKPEKIDTLFSPYLRGYNLLRGSIAHTMVGAEGPEIYQRDGSRMEIKSEAKDAFYEFLDACDESNIENIIFVSFPHTLSDPVIYKQYQRHQEVSEILSSRGYEYLDLDLMSRELNFDMETEWNSREHLSIHGSRRFTPWLINLLKDKYDLSPTELSEKQKEEWELSVEYDKRFYKYFNEYVKDHAPKTRAEDKTLWESPGIMKKLEDLG